MAFRRKRMPYKRNPTEGEIAVLAERFRGLWGGGEAMLPWLREHGSMLKECVATEWTWDAVARALTAAKITYQTGRPWTAQNLKRKIREALEPAKNSTPLQQDERPARIVAPHDQRPDVAAGPAASPPMIIPDFSGQPATRPVPARQSAPPLQKLSDEEHERLKAKYGPQALVDRRALELRGEEVLPWTQEELEEQRIYEADKKQFRRRTPGSLLPPQDEYQREARKQLHWEENNRRFDATYRRR